MLRHMLCQTGSTKDLQRPEMLSEIKFDGTRAFLIKTKQDFQIQSRPRKNGGGWTVSDYTRRLPLITREAKNIDGTYVLDGEICFFNGKGISEFTPCQRRCNTQNPMKIRKLMRKLPIVFMAFDVLEVEGENISTYPYWSRKQVLNGFLPDTETIRFTRHSEFPSELLEKTIKKGGEGVILKKRNSIYRYGDRSYDWLKIRPWQKGIFHVVGYTNSDKRLFKGLVLEENGKWVGNTGGGIKDTELKQLWTVLSKSLRMPKPFSIDESYTAVKTKLQVKVKYFRKTENNKLRFPSFLEIVNKAQTSLFWGANKKF